MKRPLDAERLDIIDVQKVDITVFPNLPTIQRLVVHAQTVERQSLALSFDEDALNTLVRAVEAALLAKTGARTGASLCAASEDRSIALRHCISKDIL
jgi:hypothetical protein